METLEASLVLHVGNQPEEDSEDEEAITRKEELQQLLNQELCDDLLEDSEEELTFYSPPPKNNEVLNSNWPYNTETGETDTLKGTSQAYDVGGSEMIPSALPISDTVPASIAGETTGLYDHLGRAQLEALYYSKCNQMKHMETQINMFQDEQDKKLGALRHLNRQLEAKKLVLLEEIEKQRRHCDEMTQRVNDYDTMMGKIESVEKHNEELTVQLHTAQATIQSLTTQLSDLSQTDAIQKLRHNYETALVELQKQHKIEMSAIQSQRVASPQAAITPSPIEECIDKSSADLKMTESVETFNYSEIEQERRRDLIAQVEDLTSQVLSEQEKVIVAEDKSQNLQLLLDEMKSENELRVNNQKKQIWELQAQLDSYQKTYEAKLKTSLEQCRTACLKLHEDASKRLKEEFAVEASQTEEHYLREIDILRKEIATLKSSLVTTQQQLMESNRQKDAAIEESVSLKQQLDETNSETNAERRESKWQHKVDLAVAAARKLWIDSEDKRTKEIIQMSLKQINERHSVVLKKVMSEKEETNKLLKECNKQKLTVEQELKKTKERLKKVSMRSNNLEAALKDLKQSLPLLQTDIVNLMSSTLKKAAQMTTRDH